MSKVCEICDKATIAGKRIQHHHSIGWRFKAPRSLRVFKPNLRTVQLEVEGKVVRATVCMKCYKKLRSQADAEAVLVEQVAAEKSARVAAKAAKVAAAGKPKSKAKVTGVAKAKAPVAAKAVEKAVVAKPAAKAKARKAAVKAE